LRHTLHYLLQGPLGPETLKARYGLKEPEQLKLYRVLYKYTVTHVFDVFLMLLLGLLGAGGGDQLAVCLNHLILFWKPFFWEWLCAKLLFVQCSLARSFTYLAIHESPEGV